MRKIRNNKKRNNKNNNKIRPFAEQQIAKRINLYREKARKNITSVQTVYVRIAGNTYSLATGSDVRFLGFTTPLSSTEFTNMAAIYNNYRIVAASVSGNPYAGINTNLNQSSNLYLTIDPEGALANPTNLTIISSDTARVFCATSNRVEVVTWSFPGPSYQTNFWLDTASASGNLGSFYLGSNLNTTNSSGAAIMVYDLRFDLTIEFANPK
jgi:hypothetical protein